MILYLSLWRGMPTLKPVILTIHQMQPFRPGLTAPIQEGTYFHTDMRLFIRESGTGFDPR